MTAVPRRFAPIVPALAAALAFGGAAATAPPAGTTPADTAPSGEWTVRPGIHQATIEGGSPGTHVRLLDANGTETASGDIDLLGGLIFRGLADGKYTAASEAETSQPFAVLTPDDVPDQSFYDGQDVEPGFGYIETRDGTTLSAWVSLPGDIADGPYPTLVEYSGYGPSDPHSTGFPQLINALGYAYVGVNMRGSGCSGGSYNYFDDPQVYDGYDVIEAIAAQPWVQDHRVGMTGVSYPGISQLFVAQTQPPSLAAITPFSVIDDSYRATLYPGGILNTGFAVNWLSERMKENAFRGQPWTVDQIESGDTTCAANQNLRLQNPDLVSAVEAAEFYDPAVYDATAPRLFVDQIDVPVLLAGAWQDEQTGGHFANMLENFTGTDHFYATLTNGLHTESIGAGSFPRMVEFLDLYVAHRVPSLDTARAIAPALASAIFGTDQVTLPPDRFTGMTYEEALAAFESDPPVQVLFEEGAADGAVPGTPEPRFTAGFASWPPPETVAHTWYLGADGTLSDAGPTPAAGTTTYTADPSAVPATFFDSETGDNVWAYDVQWDWEANPAGTAASFVSAPFDAETILTGSGAVNLWIRSDAPDTDIEVTLSELRPDGQELYIQSGWLRASERALAPDATELRPTHTHLEADAAPLPPGEWTPVNVEVFPFAHPMRPGSRLRLTVDAPGGNRAEWEFDTIAAGETVDIAMDTAHPSSLVIGTIDPVAAGIDIPDGYPTCTLRGEPCRLAP